MEGVKNPQETYKEIIKSEYKGISEAKANWISQYAIVHESTEAARGTFLTEGAATPANTFGLGNIAAPQSNSTSSPIGNTGADFHSPAYQPGSGDVAQSTLPIAMHVAATTIGLELVPISQATAPMHALRYVDYPYAGGKGVRPTNLETIMSGIGEGATNKPAIIKVIGDRVALEAAVKGYTFDDDTTPYTMSIEQGTQLTFTNGTKVFTCKYDSVSREDGSLIVKTISAKDGDTNCSIIDVFTGGTTIIMSDGTKTADITKVFEKNYDSDGDLTNVSIVSGETAFVKIDMVDVNANFVPGFDNFYDGSNETMTRAEQEEGQGNVITARYYTKWVQMGSTEVVGSLTRTQMQDMPAYGIDPMAGVIETMQNNLTQSINNKILTRLFRLGVTNAIHQKSYQGVDLNLFISNDTSQKVKTISEMCGDKYVDIHGKAHSWPIKNAFNSVTSGETYYTYQRRIMSQVLGARNLITQTGRRGQANFIVCSTAILTQLQDSSQFQAAPMSNTLDQSGMGSLYNAGTLSGMAIYVDPYMDWQDGRVLVGRKGDGKSAGCIFMPYILADTIQVVPEGTLGWKMATNSRFAIVDAGFNPEFNYYTLVIDSNMF